MDPDALLFQRMKLGEPAAVDQFVEKYYPLVLRYCRLRIRDPGYAEDAAQETFARFFQTFPRYRHQGKAANFLYVIAGNLCRDFYRREQELPLDALPEESTEPDLDVRADLRAALDALAPELREVALLYFVQELRQREIASILHIGLPLVKYRVRRAREALRAYLTERGLSS